MTTRPLAPLLVLLLASSAFAAPKANRKAAEGADPEKSEGALVPADTDLIDVPTAAILDYGGYSSRTRFFSNGGIMEWLGFGVFQRLNVGASMNVDRLIGTATPVQLTRPDLQVKFRFFDGDRVIPAAVVGYDGQGFLYNRPAQKYNQRQRGFYVAGSQEIGVPGLHGNLGMNISDFNSNAVFGFMAADYNLRDKVLLMWEWDNLSDWNDSRINMGFRTYVTPSFHLDFAVRGVGQGGTFSNGVTRGAERVVNFKYTGNF